MGVISPFPSSIKKVLIIQGSRQIPLHEAYEALKKINPKVRFIIMDSWIWPVRKSDQMILLPVTDMIKTIKDNI
jgi:hypothetical protein